MLSDVDVGVIAGGASAMAIAVSSLVYSIVQAVLQHDRWNANKPFEEERQRAADEAAQERALREQEAAAEEAARQHEAREADLQRRYELALKKEELDCLPEEPSVMLCRSLRSLRERRDELNEEISQDRTGK